MEYKNQLGMLAIVCIVLVAGIFTYVIISSQTGNNPFWEREYTESLKTFSSINEIKEFIRVNSEGAAYYDTDLGKPFGATAPTMSKANFAMEDSSGSIRSGDFSTTNIQVAGVDEPDIVKNDGKYIYALSRNRVIIIDAYPPQRMKILSVIEFNQSIDNLFLYKNKLVVIGSSHDYYEGGPLLRTEKSMMPCYYGRCGIMSREFTELYVYDISDREKPVLETNFSSEGHFVAARMIEKYVYLITSKYAYPDNPIPPIFIAGGEIKETPADKVSYFDEYDESYSFTSIVAFDVEDLDYKTYVYLTGNTGTVYVSEKNIYLTHTRWLSQKYMREGIIKEVYIPILPPKEKSEAEKIFNSEQSREDKYNTIKKIVYDYSASLRGQEKTDFDLKLKKEIEKFEQKIQKNSEKTAIHRIGLNKKEIVYEALGEVPGRVLNQFSMDEYKKHLRIATTTGDVWGGSSMNHLYILDQNLDIVGKVEDLAKGERIYSVRFMGERAYMVTFKKVDPLFVLDVSLPNNPKVLGYLKITGYSDYLHPYDENHIIGIGKETRGGNEHFSWYQGIKISLFDVSDVENPIEKAKIEIGDRGTDSYALRDHRAVLFDKNKKILVLPILLAEINESKKQNGYFYDSAYGEPVWQGAYVFNIDTQNITVRGRITHFYDKNDDNWRFYDEAYQIKRSLYIGDYLYTISSSRVKSNSLIDITEISELEIPHYSSYEEEKIYAA